MGLEWEDAGDRSPPPHPDNAKELKSNRCQTGPRGLQATHPCGGKVFCTHARNSASHSVIQKALYVLHAAQRADLTRITQRGAKGS